MLVLIKAFVTKSCKQNIEKRGVKLIVHPRCQFGREPSHCVLGLMFTSKPASETQDVLDKLIFLSEITSRKWRGRKLGRVADLNLNNKNLTHFGLKLTWQRVWRYCGKLGTICAQLEKFRNRGVRRSHLQT